MKEFTRRVILIAVCVGIIGAIWYLEKLRSPVQTGSSAAAVPLASVAPGTTVASDANDPPAVELASPSGFINTPPFKLADLIGKKVILIDFWTYSCINCQRTIPYLNAWYEKYKDQGLVIVGVHTPEFQFEHDINNVKTAVEKYGIKYPVVLDNDYGTWNAYKNLYWPREYLIDKNGRIVHDHAGEGDYDQTEQAIQQALAVQEPMATPTDVVTVDSTQDLSPETYLGTARRDPSNPVELQGPWDNNDEFIQNTAPAKIVYPYHAKNVYFVAGAAAPVTVHVLLDGKAYKTLTIQGNQLYQLVEGSEYGNHTVELDVQQAGLQAFTFTFG